MAEDRQMTREERLAARLRDNLRRRKDQARALTASGSAANPHPDDTGGESAAPLSKQGPSG